MNKADKETRAFTDKRTVGEEDKRWLDTVCQELVWRIGKRAVVKLLVDKLDSLYSCHKFEKRIARLEGKAASLEIEDGETKEELWEMIEKINEDNGKVGEILCEIDKKHKEIDRVFLDLEENLSSLEKILAPEKPSLKEL